ncbi:hypothetical protein GCM10010954_26910 [Halobacillus andaensis]|uniref:WYL domain-containing protein n=1 Tax=Halobacillus andaensis TaxID=1176239 RepID=A0A917B822_HALAA|nr:hypothetical protein [Halobacillus andaensis]MBP2005724.1 putative DNA-binding transcriptional regulator YafY [Halobacillus andaensis]GGF26489.1 hypothetical protein GCM10010954_26910 [Halobacillus andaensis]
MEGWIKRSAERKEKVEIIYLSVQGEVSQRVIQVLQVQSEYIIAFCYSKNQVRTFNKVNILSAFPRGNKRLKGVS